MSARARYRPWWGLSKEAERLCDVFEDHASRAVTWRAPTHECRYESIDSDSPRMHYVWCPDCWKWPDVRVLSTDDSYTIRGDWALCEPLIYRGEPR
jgi:hypothetical protein